MSHGRAVVVTTEKRGVFFGYVQEDTKLPAEVTLADARMCVYWSAATRGVLGLAATGPAEGSRVSLAVPMFTTYQVTSISDCTAEAIERWEESPWSD